MELSRGGRCARPGGCLRGREAGPRRVGSAARSVPGAARATTFPPVGASGRRQVDQLDSQHLNAVPGGQDVMIANLQFPADACCRPSPHTGSPVRGSIQSIMTAFDVPFAPPILRIAYAASPERRTHAAIGWVFLTASGAAGTKRRSGSSAARCGAGGSYVRMCGPLSAPS